MRPLSLSALAALAIAVSGCASGSVNSASTAPAPTQDRWVDSVMATMTLREKAAQIVWPSLYADYTPGDSPQWRRLTDYITREKVGGFTMSVGSPIEMGAKLNAMQAMSSIPLLIGADLEAGAGYRARGGYFIPNGIDLGSSTIFPPQMALGATGDTALAYEMGRVTALEGRALGIHIAYAPVLDVNNNPANPVINTRSFGEDPVMVARLGAAFIRGVQANGMVATGKHFPGHGDTDTNSHLDIPVVTVSRNRLDSVELVPFRAAIGTGVTGIMSFHGEMLALDSSGVPGTLSQKVMTGVLRDDLHFKGVVISDAMDMVGVLKQFGADEAVKRGIAAGIDILIQPQNVSKTIDAVLAGISEGRYTEARLDQSVRRVLQLKRDFDLEHKKTVSLESLRMIVGDSSHVAAARQIAERSITLVKDSLGEVPVAPAGNPRILSITIARRADLSAGATFNGELRGALPIMRTEFLSSDDQSPDYSRLDRAADSADVTIVGVYATQTIDATASTKTPLALAGFLKRLSMKGKRTIVVSFNDPYLLRQIPWVPTYVVAWGGFPPSQLAAARAILGINAISGKLPISIPVDGSVIVRGTGIARPAISK
ncbi:MAG TPA: glycoside hydrolase family 3 N-terminal domain-containing protein [Gemmatimonadaceae bacterium]|nr:glycoside hydrolase family 3 N-terminal domain-containing protein [Gemmatimonadaceae bacterium]